MRPTFLRKEMANMRNEKSGLPIGEPAFVIDTRSESPLVFRSRDLVGAESGQVAGEPLRIEQGEAAGTHALHQRVERNLRGISHFVKHRFAEKRPAECN